jgi:hypothetical protein
MGQVRAEALAFLANVIELPALRSEFTLHISKGRASADTACSVRHPAVLLALVAGQAAFAAAVLLLLQTAPSPIIRVPSSHPQY